MDKVAFKIESNIENQEKNLVWAKDAKQNYEKLLQDFIEYKEETKKLVLTQIEE